MSLPDFTLKPTCSFNAADLPESAAFAGFLLARSYSASKCIYGVTRRNPAIPANLTADFQPGLSETESHILTREIRVGGRRHV